MKKTAIVLGATGLTGNYLLKMLLNSDSYNLIKVFTRKSTNIKHQKLEEIICDLHQLEQYKHLFTADEVFCCIGTTKTKTPNKEIYHSIDYGIPVLSANLAQENGIPTFSVISSIGANPNSSVFYSRTKGQMEESILKLNIPNILIYRPSIIYGNRKDKRIAERIGKYLMDILQVFFIGNLKNYKSIYAKDLAEAIYIGAQNKVGHQIIYKKNFNLNR